MLVAVAVATLGLSSLPSPPVWAATGGGWVQLHPATSPPSPFSRPPPPGHVIRLAFDAATQETVLFTGDQTWTFDGATWTERHPASIPPLNGSMEDMTYDAGTGAVVLLLQLTDGSVGTWNWDGANWVDQHPPVEPPASGQIAYDSARNRVIAQIATGPRQAETWAWDGVTWKAMHPATEAPQGWLVHDPAMGTVVSYGVGWNSSQSPEFQTWTWDGLTWTQQHPMTSPPLNCAVNAGSFDGTQVITLTGCGATWAWDGGTWANLQPAVTPPSPRDDFRLAYDGTRVILFGGTQLSSSQTPVLFNDTWALSSNAVARRPWSGGHDAVGVTNGATDAYFAEGYTGLNFFEYLTVQNAGAAQTLTVDYFNDSGTVVSKQHALGAGSRTTILVNADVGPGQAVGAHLHAANAFVAERPMYFSWNGLTGGDDVMGAQSLNTTYYFAEGYTGPGFTEFLALLNPGTAPAAVNITYYFNNGSAPKTVAHVVAPTSRMTIRVNDPSEAGPGHEVSVRVISDKPILAERPMYFNFFGESGGSDVVGSPTLMTDQTLAEGHVGQGFDEYLTLFNPNPVDVPTTITYFLESGPPHEQLLTLSANSRTTVHVNTVLPAGSDSSVHVHASLPVLVERPMYFTFNGWSGGHDAMATSDSVMGVLQNFAEGFVGANFYEYLTVVNPNPSRPAHMTINYADPAGHTIQVAVTINPQARWTERVNTDLPSGTSNSVTITSDVPIVAERPMYFAY